MLSEKHFIKKHSIEMPDSELHISDPIRVYLNSNEKSLLIKEKKKNQPLGLFLYLANIQSSSLQINLVS